MAGIRSKVSFNSARPQWDRIRTSINQTKTSHSDENPALYQVLEDLVTASQSFQTLVDNQLSGIIRSLAANGALPPGTLLGRGSSSSGDIQIITLDSSLEMIDTVLGVSQEGDWDFVITKQALQDVIDSTTLVDDTELQFDIDERDCWLVQLLILYAGSNSTGDYKFDLSLPNVNGWIRYIADNDPADAILVSTGVRLSGATALAASIALGTDAALTPRMLWLETMFRAGDTAPFIYQFANNVAGTGRVSRTYEGSVLRARRLSVIPFGQSGPSDPGSGGTGPGAGSNPPTVPFPNDFDTVVAYDAANPGQITQTEINSDFMNGVVAALQAISLRYGHNYKRGISSGQGFSTDAISYYHGSGAVPPADGDPNVYVIDIVAMSGTPSAAPAWQNVTTPLAAGGYHLGPV